MSPRPDVSEERKNQIIEAASVVFSRLGFHKARMDDIVEESGLSKGTLYWYFKSKDDIITAILDRMFTREIAQVRKALDDDKSAKENLEIYTKFVVADLLRMQPLMPIFIEFFTLAMRKKSILKVLNSYYKSFLELIIPVIQLGIERGELRPVAAEDIAIAIGAIFEGTILLWIYDPDSVALDKNIESSINLLLEGILIK